MTETVLSSSTESIFPYSAHFGDFSDYTEVDN